MTNLTSTLKLQHLFISNLLEAAQWIGVEKLQAQRKLRAAKTHLVAHFKLEDTHLYPVLFEAAEYNADLKRTLDFLAKDMAGVSKEVMRFLEQCHHGDTHQQPTQDIGNILFLLQTRIRREEDTLYDEFDRLKAAARTMVAVQIPDSRLSLWASSPSIQHM
ncbi:hypothetical protein [Nitrospira defluvii]|uniref:Hemerythrin-like domain-containing protein n=1 Tax=Nitrospira defluvii TaxID=330214 RepID=A0ABN7MDE2_9BACT|nr:hypothetical protein [Nitrospira defluvii]CAE6799919.1 conserved hypothetical protein [Nitrospira defluvii]